MENLKIILAMIGLVAIGFVAGFHTNKVMVHKKVEEIARFGPKIPFHERMINLLELTPEQQQVLAPVLKEHHERIRGIHQDFRVHRQQLVESLHEALADELTEEQRTKLKNYTEKRQRRFKSRKEGRPGHERLKKRQEAH